MKRAITTAIKAAGLDPKNFTITSNTFTSTLKNVNLGNAQMKRVAKHLKGHTLTGYYKGYGALVTRVDAYRHDGHDQDGLGSVNHY